MLFMYSLFHSREKVCRIGEHLQQDGGILADSIAVANQPERAIARIHGLAIQ